MKFITYSELNKDLIENIFKIPRDIDLIVGIPRSGLALACMIGLYMNKPVTDLDAFLQERFYSVGKTKNHNDIIREFSQTKKVLIVEDTVCSGNSIRDAKQKVKKYVGTMKIIYLAAYTRRETRELVDINFKDIDDDRVFEWNYLHNTLLERACVDMDGVLCIDPTEEENDDGWKYKKFIETAKIKLLPTRKIGYIVTSRLEKYREETEAWLHKNNIQYNKLYMMDFASAQERRKLGNHAEYKAKIYKQLKDTCWFIESNNFQAQRIAEMTGKGVFCIESRVFYPENYIREARVKMKYEVIRPLKRRLKLCLFNLKKWRGN